MLSMCFPFKRCFNTSCPVAVLLCPSCCTHSSPCEDRLGLRLVSLEKKAPSRCCHGLQDSSSTWEAPDQHLLTAREQDQDLFPSSISKAGRFPVTPAPVHVSQLVTGACSSLSCHKAARCHEAPAEWHGDSHPPGSGFHMETCGSWKKG